MEETETEEDSYCFMERQHSPTTPLDTPGSLDALSPSPFYRASLPKSAAALAAPDKQKMAELAAAAAPLKPPAPSRGARAPRFTDVGAAPDLAPQPAVSAFAVAASCPADFNGELLISCCFITEYCCSFMDCWGLLQANKLSEPQLLSCARARSRLVPHYNILKRP